MSAPFSERASPAATSAFRTAPPAPPGAPCPPAPTPAAGTLNQVRLAVGSDHAGFAMKSKLVPLLEREGHDVADVGTNSEEPTDYPQFAEKVAKLVAGEEAERGVLVCGSGAGVAIVANKVDGVRAVNAHDEPEAKLTRQHNDANVLALSGRQLEEEQAAGIIRAFLATDFEGGRHKRRVDQIAEIERSRG